MHNIELLWNKVAIEKSTKAKSKASNERALFVENPEISDNYGVVKFIGRDVQEPPFQVGDRVYYGNKLENLRMAGEDVLVMEVTNVLAIAKEEAGEEASQ